MASIRLDDFEIMCDLRAGTFKSCQKIKRKKDQKILVWKCVTLNQRESIIPIIKELGILKQLIHPYIVKYHGYVVEHAKSVVYIISDYCPYGDLAKLIDSTRREDTFLDEDEIWKYFCQLSIAVEYCHEMGIIHRDIRPANVFLSKKGDVLLGNWGIAKLLCRDDQMTYTVISFSPYLSPESLTGRGHNAKADVWSLGCVIHELCCLEPAFKSEAFKRNHVTVSETNTTIPIHYSQQLVKLVKRMLTNKPEDRPSMKDLVTCPDLASKFQVQDNQVVPSMSTNNNNNTQENNLN